MPRVTLARAWNPGVEHYAPGAEVEVSDDVAAWLDRTGAVARPVKKRPVPPAKRTETTESAAPPVDEEEPESTRPARSAPLDTWKAYAEAQGIQTKGMSKQDIIAATA